MLGLFKKKTKVILDTNFLFIPGDVGFDIFSGIKDLLVEPFEFCVLDSTIFELNKVLSTSARQKQGLNAKLALILIKQKNLKTLRGFSSNYADDAILDYAAKNPGVVVATQDRDLKLKLKKLSVRVIVLRQRKYLELG